MVCGEPPYWKPADPKGAEEQLSAASEDAPRGPTVMAPHPPPDAAFPTGLHADEPYTPSDCQGTSGPLVRATSRLPQPLAAPLASAAGAADPAAAYGAAAAGSALADGRAEAAVAVRARQPRPVAGGGVLSLQSAGPLRGLP